MILNHWKFILIGFIALYLYHNAQSRSVTQQGPAPMPSDVTTLGGSW